MIKRQTPIQWLLDNLPSRFGNALINECSEELEKAEQLFKEYIVEAFDTAYQDEDRIGREYYEETFKTDNHDRKDISKT